MSFTIPSVASAWNAIQARVQSGDLQILTDGINGVGVVSGCAVTAQGSPDMTVAIASGVVRIGGANISVTGGNVSIGANASGNPRLDLICVNSSASKSTQAGTAAASPVYPAIPANSVVLAAVLVVNGATSIASNPIVDKRVFVTPELVAANNLSDLVSASTARTNLGLGSIATQAASAVAITGGSVTGITDLAVADGGTGASTAAGARTNLGLDTMATQAASGVAITGGSVTGITDLAVADGGTGASTAAGARTNLDAAQTSHAHAASDVTSGTIATARLGSGTANSSSYLRGDQTWAAVSAGASALDDLTDVTITTPETGAIINYSGSAWVDTLPPIALPHACSDETTTLTSTGNPKLTRRMPHGMKVTEVRASLTTASSSGAVTVDINAAGTSILSTKLTIDQGEKTSTTAATPAVISTSELWDDAEITFDIDGAGTGATGLKVTLIGTRAVVSPPAAADITFIAETHTTYATRTNTTVAKPTGTTNGDYILLGIVTGTATEALDPTPPAGFTLLTGFPSDVTDGSFNVEMRVYGRIASGEGADWTFTHSSNASQGFALTYRNVHATTQMDVNPTIATGTGSTSTASSITPATNNAMIVFIGHDWGSNVGTLTPPTGTTPTFTERIDAAGPSGIVYVADGLLATAGATGSKAMTNNNTPASSDSWAACLIALRPV